MKFHKNKVYEREFINLVTKLGVDAHRIAGSGAGSEAVCDCILFQKGKVFLVEVKATKQDRLYMDARIKPQLQEMQRVCKKHSLIPLLAIKFKRRGWNVIRLNELKTFVFNAGGIFDENSRFDY